jgi:hypothetical protein
LLCTSLIHPIQSSIYHHGSITSFHDFTNNTPAPKPPPPSASLVMYE